MSMKDDMLAILYLLNKTEDGFTGQERLSTFLHIAQYESEDNTITIDGDHRSIHNLRERLVTDGVITKQAINEDRCNYRYFLNSLGEQILNSRRDEHKELEHLVDSLWEKYKNFPTHALEHKASELRDKQIAAR